MIDDPAVLARRVQPGWLRGFDASKFQLEVDFPTAKASGICFGWIREGESTWPSPDDRWFANWAACHAAGIPCGPYHPVHGDAPGRDQARILRDRCRDWLRGRDLRPAIDLETRGGAPLHEAEAMAEEVETLFGIPPILYVGKWFAREIGLTCASPLARLPLWLPAYVDGPPELPDAWDRWTVWQYSGNGRVPGITTACDLDVIRSQADLDELRGAPPVERAPDTLRSAEPPRASADDAPLTLAQESK